MYFITLGAYYYYRYVIRYDRDGGNDLAKARQDQARGDDNDSERNYHPRLCAISTSLKITLYRFWKDFNFDR